MNKITQARADLGVSRWQLAKLLGMDHSSIWRMEKEQQPVTPRTEKAIDALVSAKGLSA